MSVFKELPSRIRYYLLEWKDRNMQEYINMHGEKKLNDLSYYELTDLFFYATRSDNKLLKNRLNDKC